MAEMERESESSFDRITNLPSDVIQRILVLLSIKDAAKTAALSTKWRHHWRRIPQLVFDGRFAAAKQGGPAESAETILNRVMLNIYKVLLLHDGPVTKFVLLVPGLRPCHGNEIDQFILYLSARGLQRLTLTISAGVYKLHSALFSCLGLSWLNLCRCEFRPPSPFVGFSKLTVLALSEVNLPADFFENFIVNCPVLRDLLVLNCAGPSNVQVVAPSLGKFVFGGYLQSICFKNTPLLEVVIIGLGSHGKVEEPADSAALFASLPALQTFYFDFRLLQHLASGDNHGVPSRIPAPLDQLNLLHIKRLDCGSFEKARLFVCLIMSCPNLYELAIKLDRVSQAKNDAATSIGTLLEAERRHGSSECGLQQLREFRIDGCLGTQVELDLVKFVLATAPILERVHVPYLFKLSSEKVIEFMTKVMRYKRVSKEAEVIYDDSMTKTSYRLKALRGPDLFHFFRSL